MLCQRRKEWLRMLVNNKCLNFRTSLWKMVAVKSSIFFSFINLLSMSDKRHLGKIYIRFFLYWYNLNIIEFIFLKSVSVDTEVTSINGAWPNICHSNMWLKKSGSQIKKFLVLLYTWSFSLILFGPWANSLEQDWE